jgi:hypothetical protein
MRLAGGILIVLGFVLLALGGLPYKEKTNIAEIGDLRMQVTEEKKVRVPPVVSGLLILGGTALMFVRRKAGP